MQKLFLAIVALTFVAYVYSQTCTPSGTYCQSCTYNYTGPAASCGGTTYYGGVSCVQPSAVPPSGNNTCGLSTSTYYCVGGVTNATTAGDWSVIYSGPVMNAALATCQANNNTNSACCALASCPVSCSSQPVTSTVTSISTSTVVANGQKYCFNLCTSCNSGRLSNAYCVNNCGTTGPAEAYSCTNTNCCNVGSASNLASWLSYLF